MLPQGSGDTKQKTDNLIRSEGGLSGESVGVAGSFFGDCVMLKRINLAEKFALIRDSWKPHVVGEVNDALVKLVRFRGEFLWHHHDNEDELFLVVSGRMTMRLRDGDVSAGPGEFIIVPRGVEHMPVAEPEAEVLLFEPRTTLNTGNVRNERTIETLPRA